MTDDQECPVKAPSGPGDAPQTVPAAEVPERPKTLSEKRAEAGRKGGKANASRNRENLSRAGKKGGTTTLERHGTAHFSEIGKTEGTGKAAAQTLKERYGDDYFKRIPSGETFKPKEEEEA